MFINVFRWLCVGWGGVAGRDDVSRIHKIFFVGVGGGASGWVGGESTS